MTNYRMRLHDCISDIPAAMWNHLVECSHQGNLHPCLRHEFLNALEQSQSIGNATGWTPCHISLWDEDNHRLLACCPQYLKHHSYGEYVFDWAWANAYQGHGLDYYPKLLVAIPFTPVSGERLLASEVKHREKLAQTVLAFARTAATDPTCFGVPVSSWHGLFFNQNDSHAMAGQIALKRKGVQFHWRNQVPGQNRSYDNFEDFLSHLSQKKRKNIQAERRKTREAGVSIHTIEGTDITPDDWNFFYMCYATTYLQHNSTPYLKRSFFDWLARTMPEQTILFIAKRQDQPVAASFCLHNNHTLYGRYWGALEHIPCLHFEVAYYSPLTWAIERGLKSFEGGAQGEHKWARGFEPVSTASYHWLAHDAFYDAVERFLEREGEGVLAYRQELWEHSPFKSSH